MKYDFENVVDRTRLGSSKWNDMLKANPDVPKGIVPLSVADMELKNPPQIIEGLKAFLDADTMTLGYTSPTEEYEASVYGWMTRRHGWQPDMRWNVLSAGVVSALFNAVRAFSEPGEGVIIFSPVYYPFKMAIEMNEREVFDVPLIFGEAHYQIDWEAFETAAKNPQCKLLLFCSPHNPVGRVWTETELSRVCEICTANDILVVSDEIHNDLIMPGYRHTIYASLSREAEQNCVICTSPSKTFSLAGIQTSNIFIPNEKLRERFLAQTHKCAVFSLNTLGYKACELAYNQCEDWLEQAISLISENAASAERFLSEHVPEIKVYPLEGTYLQWWDCRALFPDYKEMESFMRQKAYLFLDEGYLFGDTGKGFERINLACPAHVLLAALERLNTALKAR